MLNNRRQLEFKSYGLYSTVAKDTVYTIDQIETVYSWYIKNTVKALLNGDSVQANLVNLGKIKFHPKKGMIRLKNQQDKVLDIMGYYNKTNTLLEKETNPEDREQHISKLGRIYLLLKNRLSKLELTTESYKIRLDKVKHEGAISDEQYDFQKNRYDIFLKKQTQIYEPIQRIFTTHEERYPEFRQSI